MAQAFQPVFRSATPAVHDRNILEIKGIAPETPAVGKRRTSGAKTVHILTHAYHFSPFSLSYSARYISKYYFHFQKLPAKIITL
ncbi:MAG: hypothetical protein FJ126_08105 [Deltaproteobacteria bacterium]|nr:hypothetical protein [Deltaproteobacteria bacterium]